MSSFTTNAIKQAAADGYKAAINTGAPYISLHTASPGTTGANEASGGGYVRVQATYSSGSTGTLTASEITITVPAGTYTHAGEWSASTAGTYYDGCVLSSSIVMGSAGTIKITPGFTQS